MRRGTLIVINAAKSLIHDNKYTVISVSIVVEYEHVTETHRRPRRGQKEKKRQDDDLSAASSRDEQQEWPPSLSVRSQTKYMRMGRDDDVSRQ